MDDAAAGMAVAVTLVMVGVMQLGIGLWVPSALFIGAGVVVWTRVRRDYWRWRNGE